MRVLSFFAHPDDETMLIGGTLALLAQFGAEVHYLCATRGEGGELGDPPVCDRERIAEIRTGELSCAVQALGGESLAFMDYIDPLVGPQDELYAFSADVADVTARLELIYQHIQPDALITHGTNGEYGHPAHVLVNQAARALISMLGPAAPLWYTVHASFPDHPRPQSVNKDDPADFVLDITPILDYKVSAALCHRSQHALFIRRRSEEAGRLLTVPEVIQPLESLHRAYPRADGLLLDPLAEILLRSGCVRAQ